MGPHDIDDVPRREEREETRQLMLGLVDELPDQERRGILLIKILGLGLLIVLFIVLVWITAPSGQPVVPCSGTRWSSDLRNC